MVTVATIIAIDGLAASGKSAISHKLAKKLKMSYLDTGAIYRAIALEALKKNIKTNNVLELIKLVDNIKITFKNTEKEQKIIVNNRDVTVDIRSEKISYLSSIISVYRTLREKLCFLQRNLCRGVKNGIIVEGRDIGTVVFPNAKVKIFLKASKEERARRRALQLCEITKGNNKKILKGIIERDRRDITRKIAPLKSACDAIIIDTTTISLEKVVNLIELYIVKILK